MILPPVRFTNSVRVPNKLKIRKKLVVWPLKFSAGVDYHFAKDELKWVCTCKEKIFGGRIALDASTKSINYRKTFQMSNGPSLCLHAQCPYIDTGDNPTGPSFGFSFSTSSGNHEATAVAPCSFDLRTKIPISRRVRSEVCANVGIPMLQPQYSAGGNGSEIAFHDGSFSLHLAEINAIVYV